LGLKKQFPSSNTSSKKCSFEHIFEFSLDTGPEYQFISGKVALVKRPVLVAPDRPTFPEEKLATTELPEDS
jgi:hypothetical protein